METKKSSKGLIVLVVILSVLLLVALTHICYNKFMTDDNKEVVKPKEQTKLTESEVKELHSTLMTKDKSSGFYFKENTTKDNIDDHELLEYALINYYIENDLKSFDVVEEKGSNLSGSTEDNTIKYAPDTSKVSAEKIAEYIKDNFNIDRNPIFDDDYKESDKYIKHHLYNGKSVVYDKNSKTYIFYVPHRGAEITEGTSKMIKYEQDKDNVYIYGKAVFCTTWPGGGACYNAANVTYEDKIPEIASLSGVVPTPSNLKREDVNSKYIIENMNDKLDTYKHTFKKADNGKYYWYSTEIVK